MREGEVILLVRETFAEPITPRDFDIVYDDDSILAVDKPAGLPVHPTATYHRNTVTFILKERYGNRAPQLAHRLDRETSGVLVCAKTIEVERALKNAFEGRRVQKTYLAIVRGRMQNDEGFINLPLSPVREGLHVLMEVRDDGDSSVAETHYVVRARKTSHTLVELHPKTGRQHQLRVHLAALGHPIVGDKLYGPEGESLFLEAMRQGLSPELEALLGHSRQALHAHAVEFAHPVTGKHVRIEAPLADDLEELWRSYV